MSTEPSSLSPEPDEPPPKPGHCKHCGAPNGTKTSTAPCQFCLELMRGMEM